jgi:1,4-dihydroxy-2-naphthoate polyprenyltransferase
MNFYSSHTSRLQTWLLAARPATLTAGIVPVLVGSALAARDDSFRFGPAAAALLGALLIQIGTNFVNDADDFERGADTEERLGPVRVTQQGLLSTAEVRRAAWLAFAGVALIGLYLVAVSGWPILLLGIAAILSGLAYTGGPWPLGYHGLGDLFVFLFFGFAAVLGTYYVQTNTLSTLTMVCALPVGALATAILVVNNTRDVGTDRVAGKRTLAVRFGERVARVEFLTLLGVAYAIPLVLWQTGSFTIWILLPLVTLPIAATLACRFSGATDGAAFNAALRNTARLHGIFGILFGAGLLR